MTNLEPTTTWRRAALAATAFLALGVTACVPDPGPSDPGTTTTTTAECVPAPGTATSPSGATLTVSKVTCLEVGDVVTITGSGYTATGNLGTRPPLSGQPAGVYAAFGRYLPVWQYSANAPAGARINGDNRWVLPAPSYAVLAGAEGTVLMAADGSFQSTLTITEIEASTDHTYSFVTYAGGGAKNANEELRIAASFAP